MLKWTPRPGSSACRAWRGNRARDRLEPLQHGRMELRGRRLGSVLAAIFRGFAQVAPPFPSSSTPWYVKIDHLYFIAAEWRVVYHRVYKSLPWQSQGSNCRRWICLDEFAFSLGHLKGRPCSISVSSSWNWNGNGKQCLNLCVELRWGAESSWRHQAGITHMLRRSSVFFLLTVGVRCQKAKEPKTSLSNTQRHRWMAGTRASYLTNRNESFLVIILKVALQIPIICYPNHFNCVGVLEAVWNSVDKCLTEAPML